MGRSGTLGGGSNRIIFFYEQHGNPELCGPVYKTPVVSKAKGGIQEERKDTLSVTEPDMRAAGMVTPRREWLRDEL